MKNLWNREIDFQHITNCDHRNCPLRVVEFIGFTDALKSPTSHENVDRSVLRPRLLLCLHGLGTNAGLQRMASLGSGVTTRDLTYVRHRYISVPALREAIGGANDYTANVMFASVEDGLRLKTTPRGPARFMAGQGRALPGSRSRCL